MFSAIDVRILLEALERRAGVELPRNVVEASLTNGVLHIRFEYPKSSETDVSLFQLRPLYTSSEMRRWGGSQL